jgi:PAS domain S-box-containing protein
MSNRVDVSAKSGNDRGLPMSNLDAQSVLKTMRQPFVVLDHDLVVQGANRAFYDTFDVELEDTEGRTIYDLGNHQWDIPKLRQLLEKILPYSGIVDDFMVDHHFETIGRRIMIINARQIPERSPALILMSIEDITRQEDQRQETERQKHLAEIIIDAAPVSFLILDKDLKVLRANKTFYDAFAVDREETQGRLIYELGNGQWDIPKLRELLEDVLPDNDTFNGFEVEHDFEEIGHRAMMLNARRINTHQLILLAIDDLTEERASELQENARAARREFILDLLDRQRGEASPEALIDMNCEALGKRLDAARVFYADIDDSDGHRILPRAWSDGHVTEQVGGYRVEEFGDLFLDHLKEGRTLIIENVREDARIEKPGPLAAFEELGIASLVDVPLVREGRLRAIFGVHFSSPRQLPPADVRLTEGLAERLWEAVARCRAEAELRVSEERFSLVTKATNDVIWDWDIVAGTQWWNESLKSIFGYDPAQMEPGSESWLNRIHPEDRKRVLDSVDAVLAGSAKSWTEEYRFMHADGHPLTVVDKAFIIRDAEGKAVRITGSMTDVTAKRDTENRLRQSQKLEAVGQLTGGVAHDFNNLLTVFLGCAEILSEELVDQQRKLAEMIITAAERGAELTNRLLAFARKQPLNPKTMDVNVLIRGSVGLLQRTLSENIDIRLNCPDGLWTTEVDPAQLDAAILNLSLNARDAMPAGGRLTIETANAALDRDYSDLGYNIIPGQYVMITITDTGEGIPADVLSHIFEPFYTTKEVGKGSGLGLSMVYGFVKQSGGYIHVYSEPGEGTSVRLYFPRATAAGAPDQIPETGNRLVGGEERILVVEDDMLVRKHLISQLLGLGYKVVGVGSGPEAIEILAQTQSFDLLFTDIVMPGGMSGRELADTALKMRPEIKVLFTSGYTEQAIIHNGRLDPGVQLLSKPYRRQQLAEKVRLLLDLE